MPGDSIQRDVEIRIRAWNEAQRALASAAAQLNMVEKAVEQVARASGDASVQAAILSGRFDEEGQQAQAMAVRLQLVDRETGKLSWSSVMLGKDLAFVDETMASLERQADLGAIAVERLAKEENQAAINAEVAAHVFESFGNAALATGTDLTALNTVTHEVAGQMAMFGAEVGLVGPQLEKLGNDAVAAAAKEEVLRAATERLAEAQRRGGASFALGGLRLRNWNAGVVSAITLISPLSLILGGVAVAIVSLAATLAVGAAAFGFFGAAVVYGMRKIGDANGVAGQLDNAINQIGVAGAIAGQTLQQHFFGPTGSGLHTLTLAGIALIQRLTPVVQHFGDSLIAFFKQWGPTILTIIETWAKTIGNVFSGVGAALMNVFIRLQPLALAIFTSLAEMLKQVFLTTAQILKPIIPLAIQFVHLLTRDIAGAIGIYQQFGNALIMVGVAILKLASDLLPAFSAAIKVILPVLHATGVVIVAVANALGFLASHFPNLTGWIIAVLLLASAFNKLKAAIVGSALIGGLKALVFGLSDLMVGLTGAAVLASEETTLMFRLGAGARAAAVAIASIPWSSTIAGLGGVGAIAVPLTGILAGLVIKHYADAAAAKEDAKQHGFLAGVLRTLGNIASPVSNLFQKEPMILDGVSGSMKNMTNEARRLLNSGLNPLIQGNSSLQVALQNAGVAQQNWNDVIKRASTLSQKERHDLALLANTTQILGASTIVTAKDIMAAAVLAADAARTSGTAWQSFVDQQVALWNKFHDAVVTALGNGTTALQTFAGATQVTFKQVNKSLDDLIKQQRTTFAAWNTILKKGGEAAKPLVASLASMGVGGAALSKVIASKTGPQIDALARKFGIANRNATNFGDQITNRLLGTLNNLDNILIAIAIKLGVKLPAAILASYNKLQTLNSAAQTTNTRIAAINRELDAMNSKVNAIAGHYGVEFTISVNANKLGFALAYKEFHLAMGGIINEPVIGYGQKTGAIYHLAENGPERVSPIGKSGGSPAMVGASTGGGGGDTFNIYATNPMSPNDVIHAIRYAKIRKGW